MIGGRARQGKGGHPRTCPRPCPQATGRAQSGRGCDPQTGRSGQPPALVVAQLQALVGVAREQQVAIQVDPVGQTGERRGGCDADAGLLHAAQHHPESELTRAAHHGQRGSHAAALGELDVDARDDAHEGVEVIDGHGALVGHDGDGAPLLEPAQLRQLTGRERLLDELHAQPLQLRHEPRAFLGLPAGVGIDPQRTGVHRPDRLQGRQVAGAADLDLEHREARSRGWPAPRPPRGYRCRWRSPSVGCPRASPAAATGAARGPAPRGRGARYPGPPSRRRDARWRRPSGRPASIEPGARGRRRSWAAHRAHRRRPPAGAAPRRRCPPSRRSRRTGNASPTPCRPLVAMVTMTVVAVRSSSSTGDPERVAQGQ